MTSSNKAQWVLAFDASCQTCQSIAEAVAEASGPLLEVVPLKHPRVVAWRERALGADARPRPTLLRVENDDVRAWCGSALVLPLTRRLGPRASIRVLAALGELRHEANRPAPPAGQENAAPGITRARMIRMIGGGTVIAAGLVTGISTPAFATERADSARAWVQRNIGRLPQKYSEVISYPMHYRQAIFQASSRRTQSQLWLDHLATRRAASPSLTTEQSAVIGRVENYLRKIGGKTPQPDGGPDPVLRDLEKQALAAFDRDSAVANFGVLGPVETRRSAANLPQCECAPGQNVTHCDGCAEFLNCNRTYKGCGFLYQFDCTGMCNF